MPITKMHTLPTSQVCMCVSVSGCVNGAAWHGEMERRWIHGIGLRDSDESGRRLGDTNLRQQALI